MSIVCDNCNSLLKEHSGFCPFCGVTIEEETVDVDNKILMTSSGNLGFSNAVINGYSDKIEWVTKKETSLIYYKDLKSVKKSFGVVNLTTLDGEVESFGAPGLVDEWISFIEERIDYYRNGYEANPFSKEHRHSSEVNTPKRPSQYENIKKYLKESDGDTHVIMIDTHAPIKYEELSCSESYTMKIDRILSCMQEDEYEILSVAHQLHGEYVRTLITYI